MQQQKQTLKKKILFICAALAFTLSLGGCFFPTCPKKSEQVNCPLDAQKKNYVVTLRHDAQAAPPLTIPKGYAPICSALYPVAADKPVWHVYFTAEYPDMAPPSIFSRGKSIVDIHLNRAETERADFQRLTEETGYTHDLTAYIQGNIDNIAPDGQKRYAPVKELENGFYALFDNWQPTYAMLFQRNPNGRVKNLFYCHMDTKSCSTENIIVGGMYSMRYRISDVDYRDLATANEKISSFILGFK